MRNKIVLLIIAFVIIAVSNLYAQSIDSLVAVQTNTIKQANAELSMSLKTKAIQDRFPHQWKRIVGYKKRCNTYLQSIKETNDECKKMEYIEGAFRSYNKARKLYNKITSKKIINEYVNL